MVSRFSLINFPIGFLLAASLTLTACGGSSGGGDDGGGDGGARDVPEAGNNVEGPIDNVQDPLTEVADGAGDAPVVGPTAESLVNSLVSLLDAADGITGGLQDFLTSQDPQELLKGGDEAGTAILSFSRGLQDALLELNQQGQEIPGLDQVLTQLETVQQRVKDASSGDTEGGDVSGVTDALRGLTDPLSELNNQLPDDVQNQALVGDLLTSVTEAVDDLGIVLDETGELDGSGTSQAVTGLLDNLKSNLADSLPGGAGAQFEVQVDNFTDLFSQGLGVLLEPLFQTLRGVLAPVTGDDAPLNILGGSGSLGEVDRSDVSGPLLQLGDLLASLAGADGATGGADALEDSLSWEGSIPIVGNLLQGVLDGTKQLPVIGDLLGSLLAPGEDGSMPINDLFPGDGSGSIAGLLDTLNGLLSNLLGMAEGGQDGLLRDPGDDSSSGGLNPGNDSSSGGLGGIIEGLLGGLLGGQSN